MDEGLLKISNEINSRYKEFRFFTAVYNQGDIVYFMVFQKFLKQNQTLKYEKFVSYWVQIWYFEQYSLDIEWERPFLRILTWLQVFKLFAKTLLSLIFPRLLLYRKLIKTEKNNTVLLSVLLLAGIKWNCKTDTDSQFSFGKFFFSWVQWINCNICQIFYKMLDLAKFSKCPLSLNSDSKILWTLFLNLVRYVCF